MSGARDRWVFAAFGTALLAYLAFPFLAFLVRARGASVGHSLGSPGAQVAMRNSLLTAPISTAIATLLGVPLAYALARSSFRGQRLVEGVIVLPLVVPPVVAGAMLLSGVGHGTAVGTTLSALGLSVTNSLGGVVLAQTFVAAPFVVITARSGFETIDPRLEHASRSIGYGPIATFWYVSLPQARGMVLAGIVLTFARAIGEFGATMMVAYNPRTMPTAIWVAFVGGGIEATLPLAVALLSISLLVILATQVLAGPPTITD